MLDVVRAGLTLNWVGAGARLRSRLSTDSAAMLAGDLRQLTATLKHLVAVVDRSVQRVPLDRIAYPCYGCQDRTCQQQQRSPRFRSANVAEEDCCKERRTTDVAAGSSAYEDADKSIPHIDSDPEDSVADKQRTVDNDGE